MVGDSGTWKLLTGLSRRQAFSEVSGFFFLEKMRKIKNIAEKEIKESSVLKQVEEWLTLHRFWHMRCNNSAGKAQSGMFMRSFTCNGHAVKGVSDIYAIKDGVAFWIECKRPVGGVVSVDQRNFLDAMNRHGAVGIVVNSIESLETQLKEAGVKI